MLCILNEKNQDRQPTQHGVHFLLREGSNAVKCQTYLKLWQQFTGCYHNGTFSLENTMNDRLIAKSCIQCHDYSTKTSAETTCSWDLN